MRLISLLLLTGCLASCSTTKLFHYSIDGKEHLPKPPGFKVPIADDPPKRPYKITGVLRGSAYQLTSHGIITTSHGSDKKDLYRDFLKEAREIGADAIIFRSSGTADLGTSYSVSAYSVTSSSSSVHALCGYIIHWCESADNCAAPDSSAQKFIDNYVASQSQKRGYFSPDKISWIQKNVTTRADILNRFGSPDKETKTFGVSGFTVQEREQWIYKITVFEFNEDAKRDTYLFVEYNSDGTVFNAYYQ